jgi:hypothetical protein
MAAVAIVTKVQKMLNSLPTSQSFAVMFPVAHFGCFHGNGSHFEKNQPLKAQLHMAYDIPTRFHKV